MRRCALEFASEATTLGVGVSKTAHAEGRSSTDVKVATLLFSDIEGSTKLVQALGPDWPRWLEEHQQILRQSWSRHRGMEQGTEGDSFFVVFDDPSDAIAAAIDAQRGLASHDWPHSPVLVRIGIHTGTVQRVADGLVGIAIHEAARISAVAHGGQIIVSGETVALAGEERTSWRYVGLGEHQLKDLPRRKALFQVAADGLRRAFPVLRSHDSGANNLPAVTTTFVGRQAELLELVEVVRSQRLVTVTGAGGAGKTRIAIRATAELAEHFPSGVWLVELGTISQESGVALAVGAVLGLPGTASVEALAETVGDRDVLLVLDNCEHLVAAVAEVVQHLLLECPRLHVLATSREPLGVSGEISWRLPSLDADAAVALFEDRAKSATRAFSPTEANREAIGRIVRRLDGIPLAIELAAARAQSLSVEQIELRLEQRFRLLTGGSRTAVSRHRTLQATVDWSYDLLSPDEQNVLCRLGVFVGGFTIDAAEAVAAVEGVEEVDVVDLLDRLVAKSLVVVEDVGGDYRYRLLETIRQYAIDRLTSTGKIEAMRDQHLSWVRALAVEARPHVWLGADEQLWLDRLEAEHDNIRAALSWATETSPDDGVAICSGVCAMWLSRDHAPEGLQWMKQLVARSVTPPGLDGACFLVALTILARGCGEFDVARDAAARAAAQFDTVEDLGQLRWIVPMHRADAAVLQCDAVGLAGTREAVEDALREARETTSDTAVIWILQQLALLRSEDGDVEGGYRDLREAEQVARRVGSHPALLRTLIVLGHLALRCGHREAAEAAAEELVREAPAMRDGGALRAGLALAAVLAREDGDTERTMGLLLDLEEHARRYAPPPELSSALSTFAWLALADGDLELAEMKGAEALLIAERLAARSSEFSASVVNIGHTLAEIERARGDGAAACSRLAAASDALSRSASSLPRAVAPIAAAVGGLAIAAGFAEQGTTLLAAAAASHRPGDRLEREIAQRDKATAEVAMSSQEAFSDAWQRGTDMSALEVQLLAQETLTLVQASQGTDDEDRSTSSAG